ncbi:TIGR03086 family protein [Amycolatopsis acidicola]|uniref:TIGR03086 family protein n=1 Tax=Amycolatopsis acidicola TaxID=2596893 RepID=A0A5N0UWD3_9PSEU|nr:TIGR03086 family metal-binding protein [Amycolatopsis acidicola]KAA9153332.1 TIGR03086 family protein [Amycolatopsis acidicola]
MNPLDDFDRSATTATGLVRALAPSQFELPTACTDWSVQAVVNHLTQGNHKFAAWARGAQAPPDGDFLGDDPAGAFERSVALVRAALSEPGLLERTVETPFGPVPGATLVHMRVNEFLAHGWDIADATGQPTDFLPDLAEGALRQWRDRLGGKPRPDGGPFAAERAAPEGASAADRLAAFLGREPVRK